MKKMIATRLKQQEGATAVEYGLIAGLIAIAIVAALVLIQPQLASLFGKVATATTDANAAAP